MPIFYRSHLADQGTGGYRQNTWRQSEHNQDTERWFRDVYEQTFVKSVSKLPEKEPKPIKRIRWRQMWYKVHCRCTESFGSPKPLQKVFKIVCKKCGYLHWTYDVGPDDKIQKNTSIHVGFTRPTKTENVDIDYYEGLERR